ncbi:MAG: NUDIX hydrolase [Desulfobacterales bacterium]|jgi:ADP-ribose pyrophosphatase
MEIETVAFPRNPRLAIGAVVFHEDRVLLVQRGRPPAMSEWAVPGGRVELGETLQEAAEREVFEETGIRVRAGRAIYVFDSIHRDHDGRVRFHYVIVDLEADYVDGRPRRGDDAADVRWVTRDELNRLPVNGTTLRLLSEVYRFG